MNVIETYDGQYRIRDPKGKLTLPLKHMATVELPADRTVGVRFDQREGNVELVFSVASRPEPTCTVSNGCVSVPKCVRQALDIVGASVGEWRHVTVNGRRELRGKTDRPLSKVEFENAHHLVTKPVEHVRDEDRNQEHFDWYLRKEERAALGWPDEGNYWSTVVAVGDTLGLRLSVDSETGVKRKFRRTGKGQADTVANPPNALVHALDWAETPLVNAVLPDGSIILVSADAVDAGSLAPVEVDSDASTDSRNSLLASVRQETVAGSDVANLLEVVRETRETAEARRGSDGDVPHALRLIEAEVEHVLRHAGESTSD